MKLHVLGYSEEIGLRGMHMQDFTKGVSID